MKVFNIEIFSNRFVYKSNAQTDEVKYKYDYTDVEKNSVEVNAEAAVGDYIVIYNDAQKYYGVITDVTKGAGTNKIQYKSFFQYMDVKILAKFNQEETVEETISRLVRENYIENEDNLQNVTGLDVVEVTETQAQYGWTFADGVVNLFDVIQEAFTTYGVVCDFAIDRQEKEILMLIEKVEGGEFHIEPDLKNILDRNIVLKKGRETANKILIYNEEDMDEQAIFYKDENEEITQNPTSRIQPVIFTTKAVKLSKDQLFIDKATAEAANNLKKTKYENLMEFIVEEDDLLIRPMYRLIGQEAVIHMNDKDYTTILTGYEYGEGKAKLIFGIIRNEITKLIKKKWRS